MLCGILYFSSSVARFVDPSSRQPGLVGGSSASKQEVWDSWWWPGMAGGANAGRQGIWDFQDRKGGGRLRIV